MRLLLFLVGIFACAQAPSVSVVVTGSPETVFDTKNSCELIDVPDAPARAFRDSRGTVHLVAAHKVARAMIGRDLNTVAHDCHPIYTSPQDPNPANFGHNNWLFSFYSADGNRIAALVHSEYDAFEISQMCATPGAPSNCWWNTVTYAESDDGGYSFRVPTPPGNLVAALPYPYVVGNILSAFGYHSPSNILKVDQFYYALINNWAYKAQQPGPCLIQTSDVFRPDSWRAWSGTGFNVQFIDPYRNRGINPAEHVCAPVIPGGAVSSLSRHEPTGVFLGVQYIEDTRYGPEGIYIQASRDLKTWSAPSLILNVADLQKSDGAGNWSYAYASLLDPASTDRNFATVSSTPYLYYVRTDNNNAPYTRVLERRKIAITAHTF